MTTFPEAGRPVRGGFVLLNPEDSTPMNTIPFQFNPDTLTRTLQPQGIGGEPGDRLEALRLKGPPHETYKFDAEFDATEHPEAYPDGLLPVLSALELTIYPTSVQLSNEDDLAGKGQLEIAPVEAPLLVLVLGPGRLVPVRITDFSVTEEAFDTALSPIRAKVSVSVRVLTVDDLGYVHKGGRLYLGYQGQKETFAKKAQRPIADVGLTTI
ncbi:hypothetical protein [Amycolatopsis sp. NPDC059021]|uniref:hypothetical protein n=1 Tax=Amycolatopsis sp. NPDC059021 TaxID=3346704 RepID=UPI00366AB585